MKKALVLLLLFIFACGGSGEDTAVEDTTNTSVLDTTTTTIPPAPTSDINYIELFNSKLGTELCSDATEIDTTSEECLRKYKENLNYLITLQNEIGDFGSALIAYYETYPELVNQEYEDFINFVENDYSQVFTVADGVENKYIERFGGVPVINNIVFDENSKLSAGCTVNGKFSVGENMFRATLNYKNDVGQIFTFDINKNKLSFNLNLLTQGGTFTFHSGQSQNYLGENYTIENFSSNFYIDHLFNRVVDIVYPSAPVNKGESFTVVMYVDLKRDIENAEITFFEIATGWTASYLAMRSSEIQGNKITFNGKFIDNPDDASNWWISENSSNPSLLYFYPGQSEYELNSISLPIGGNTRERLSVLRPWGSMGLNLPGECGPIDTLDMQDAFPFMKNKKLLVNP